MPRAPAMAPDWPALMRSAMAAAYCDEESIESFLRRVGTVYPMPISISGRGRVWTKTALDQAITRLSRGAFASGEASLADDL